MTMIWITYLNTRDQLYRDMELMPLDYRGVWIDNVATCECPPEEKKEEKKDNAPETASPDREPLPTPRPLPAANAPEADGVSAGPELGNLPEVTPAGP
jgi:hypothetical protein